MIVVSGWIIGAIAISAVAWLLISLAVAMLMFGDDRAFIVGPAIATLLIVLFWLTYAGILRFE